MTSDTLTAPVPTGLAVIDRGAGTMLSVAALQERYEAILEVMANVLVEGKDYGRIPGTDKPTIFKPGAEKLCLTFLLAATDPTIEDLTTADEVRYRVRVPIEDASGRVLAVGVGEASTNEEKYRWRKPVCHEEWAETPEHLRREKWFKGARGEKPYKGEQIRTSPADLANTALKMGHKRGFIHGVLLATGASSVFNQDLEDFTKELRDSIIDAEVVESSTADKREAKPEAAQKPSAAKPAGIGPLVTRIAKLKGLRTVEKGGKVSFYVLTLEGDPTEYTTRDGKKALELEKFKGTDHLLQLGYEDNEFNGKTYHNVTGWLVDPKPEPAAAPAAPEPAKPATGEMKAGEIPFGGTAGK
jgi:hypothetical protein